MRKCSQGETREAWQLRRRGCKIEPLSHGMKWLRNSRAEAFCDAVAAQHFAEKKEEEVAPTVVNGFG